MKKLVIFVGAIALAYFFYGVMKKHRTGQSAGFLRNGARLELAVIPSCRLGDIDAIEMDYSLNADAPMLLTVENLASDGSPPFLKKTVTLHQLLEKPFFEIAPIPAPQDAVGVYLCRDQKKSGSCHSKDSWTLTDAMVRNASDGKNVGYVPPDKLYFFQPIRIVDGKVILISESNQGATTDKTFFAGERSLAASLENAKTLVGRLKSPFLLVTNNSLNMTLTRFSPDGCVRPFKWSAPK